MASSKKTVVFGGESKEVYNYQKQEFELKSLLYTQTAMTDLSRSSGVEVIHTPCEASVVAACMTSEPMHQSYERGFLPFSIITKSQQYPGPKNKPAFKEIELCDAFPSPKHADFPIFPDLDINPLYRFLELPASADSDAEQRLSFGIVVGSKKFAMNGKVFITCNMLEPVDPGTTAFGYSVLYASATETIYNYHMKQRGKPQIVLFNGYTKVGKSHVEAYYALEQYTLEDVEKMLGIEKTAGGSPLPETDATPPAPESPVEPVTEAPVAPSEKPKPAWMKKSANPDSSV